MTGPQGVMLRLCHGYVTVMFQMPQPFQPRVDWLVDIWIIFGPQMMIQPAMATDWAGFSPAIRRCPTSNVNLVTRSDRGKEKTLAKKRGWLGDQNLWSENHLYMDVYIHTHVYVCGYVLYIYMWCVHYIYTDRRCYIAILDYCRVPVMMGLNGFPTNHGLKMCRVFWEFPSGVPRLLSHR